MNRYWFYVWGLVLVLGCGCARSVHILPLGQNIEAVRDGKEVKVQKLVQVDF
jgi:hypothetical protein